VSAEQWDVFISHASEDKERVARPLATRLRAAGLRVWIDENELRLGDSLRRKIDEGLAGSRYGVVILSPAFFAKEWPQRELDALSALDTGSGKVILPVWHGVDQKSVARHSPTLADKLAVSTDRGLDQVALAIISVLSGSPSGALSTYEKEAPPPPPIEFHNPDSLLGQSLDGYELIEFVGSGGSGLVFRAKHTTIARESAVKVFYPVRESLSQTSELLERGFRALANLRHPNIAGVFEFSTAQVRGVRLSYLAMEYIRGLPLDVWSREIQSRSNASTLRLEAAIQLADALCTAHKTTYMDEAGFEVRGVLHGDLKPANVLVADNNRVKLLDFLLVDIRRLLDPRVVPPQYLHERIEGPVTAVFGTPGFMAPEQEKHGVVTIKTDIFGLGVTFAHLFAPTSNFPLAAVTPGVGIPAALSDLIKEMAAISPAARPDDMEAVSDRLRSIRTTLRSRQGLLERLRRFWQKGT